MDQSVLFAGKDGYGTRQKVLGRSSLTDLLGNFHGINIAVHTWGDAGHFLNLSVPLLLLAFGNN